jgi:hypothetical protein
MTFASYFARDIDGAAIPLIDDAYMPAEPEDTQPEPERAPLRPWAVIALLWYICHIAIVGGAYICLLLYPLEPTEYRTWQAIPIGWAAALLLWAVTLGVRRLARRER